MWWRRSAPGTTRRLIREPEVITGWAGLPPASQVISDFYLCKFPGLSQTDDSVAAALDARNDDGAIAALRRAHPSLPLVTFSHFVPRPELVPEKRYLFVPALAKAVGSTFLERRVARSEAGRACLRPHAFRLGRDARRGALRPGVPRVSAGAPRPADHRRRRLLPRGRTRPRRRARRVPAGSPFPVAPAPLLLREGGAFVPRYRCGWSAFYARARGDRTLTRARRPRREAARVPGVGEVGWGEGRARERDARIPRRESAAARRDAAPAQSVRGAGTRADASARWAHGRARSPTPIEPDAATDARADATTEQQRLRPIKSWSAPRSSASPSSRHRGRSGRRGPAARRAPRSASSSIGAGASTKKASSVEVGPSAYSTSHVRPAAHLVEFHDRPGVVAGVFHSPLLAEGSSWHNDPHARPPL